MKKKRIKIIANVRLKLKIESDDFKRFVVVGISKPNSARF